MFDDKIYIVESSVRLYPGMDIEIVNENCEFSYDSYYGNFGRFDDTMIYCVEVDILKRDLSNYVPEKSTNGGCYAFATGVIKQVIKKVSDVDEIEIGEIL